MDFVNWVVDSEWYRVAHVVSNSFEFGKKKLGHGKLGEIDRNPHGKAQTRIRIGLDSDTLAYRYTCTREGVCLCVCILNRYTQRIATGTDVLKILMYRPGRVLESMGVMGVHVYTCCTLCSTTQILR